MTKIVYVGPADEVEISDLGVTCQRGRTVDVPAEAAGRPPAGEPGTEEHDPGEGLLAQAVWSRPNTPEAKAAAAFPLEPADDPSDSDPAADLGDVAT